MYRTLFMSAPCSFYRIDSDHNKGVLKKIVEELGTTKYTKTQIGGNYIINMLSVAPIIK